MRNSDDLMEVEVFDELNTIDIALRDIDSFDTIEETTGSYSRDDGDVSRAWLRDGGRRWAASSRRSAGKRFR
ncbi:hypothetical protein PanWU01x14_033940 [Parasponia andersonii]|uniref:Uncharacterized protein n=1 Tax=Parasponia andersonii TaxID=3476 RepID=A0A2P5DTT4_PARAD|nr:hypothetical protein PanWU01x14_033940 [Parasponia andersonii]